MSRTLFFLFLLVSRFASAQMNRPFQLDGDVSKCTERFSRVYLGYSVPGRWISDSCEVSAGKYQFRGQLEHPVVAYLQAIPMNGIPAKAGAAYYKSHGFEIFLSPGSQRAVSKKVFSDTRVLGSPGHNEFEKLQNLVKPLKDSLFVILDTKAADSAGMAKKQTVVAGVQEKIAYVHARYSRQVKSSPLLFYILQNLEGTAYEYLIDSLFDRLPPSLRESAEGREMQKKRLLVSNRPAPDFVLPDSSGRTVRLSSFNGQYTLLVFWASWCKPCRAEHPGFMEVFQKYGQNGLRVVAVSLDDKKEKWLEAIAKDGLKGWVHLSDLKGWRSPMVPLYRIGSVPVNFLLDKKGIIVLKNFEGASLERFLESVL